MLIARRRFKPCRFILILLIFTGPYAYSTPLSELYGGVPRPPSDITTALSWVSDGVIEHADIVGAKAALVAERAKLATLNGGELPKGVGPVPREIADSPEVQAAARSYADYLLRNSGKNAPEAMLSKRKRWLQSAYGKRQLDISKSMQACADPCTDSAAQAVNGPLIVQRERELQTEIRSWNALFDDWKKTRRGYVISAESHVEATSGGEAATTEAGRKLMADYQAAMLNEVELLLSITELCVLRAEAIDRGLDGSEPDGLSGATKKSQ